MNRKCCQYYLQFTFVYGSVINNIIPKKTVTFSSTKQTLGHSRQLHKSRVSCFRDGHSFSKRIVNVWNSLPERIVMSKSVGGL